MASETSSNVGSLLESRTVRKAVLSRSYDVTYIISERDIRLALRHGAIPSSSTIMKRESSSA